MNCSLNELRHIAKERGLKGYSNLTKENLILALQGKPIVKKLGKNQVCIATQTDFPKCIECFANELVFQAELKNQKKPVIIYDDDLEIDADTGEVIGCDVEYSKFR